MKLRAMKLLLDTALYWHSQNISTVPLYYRSKCPASKALIKSGLVGPDGRATWLPLKQQLPTEQQIQQWFNGRKYNLALVTTENLVVLDFDTVKNFALWYCWQQENNPVVIDTYMVTTSRGLHLYYWVQEPFEKITVQHLPYEIRSHGSLTTAPPSVHQKGIPYRGIGNPAGILPVERIEDILTFSLLPQQKWTRQQFEPDPWAIKSDTPLQKVNLLELFPNARQNKNDRYWLTDCPIHGHRNNFWLDTEFNICGCFAGCGTFLASEIANLLTQ